MKTKIISFIISLFLIAACSGESKNYQPEKENYNPEALPTTKYLQEQNNPEPVNNNETLQIKRKIIKTADLEMEVQNLKTARKALNNLLKKYNAYISDEKVNEWNSRLNNEITIRVPSANFDSLLNHVSNLAVHIVSKHISLSDITEEYIDIKTRLNNKKKVEEQYLELLKKAKTIDEILQVNEHLRRLREEIESKEGRLKYLNNQVSLSTINLEMYQYTDNAEYPGFGSKIKKALKGGWEAIQVFFLALIYLWPFIIIVALIIWLIIRRRKRKNKL